MKSYLPDVHLVLSYFSDPGAWYKNHNFTHFHAQFFMLKPADEMSLNFPVPFRMFTHFVLSGIKACCKKLPSSISLVQNLCQSKDGAERDNKLKSISHLFIKFYVIKCTSSLSKSEL